MKINLFPNPFKQADIFGFLKPGGQFTKETTDSLNARGLKDFTHFHNDIAPWIAAAIASGGALGAFGAGGAGATGAGGAGAAGTGGATAFPVLGGSGPEIAGFATGADPFVSASGGGLLGSSAGGGATAASTPAWLRYAKLGNMAMNMGGGGGQAQFGGPPQHQFVGPENPYTAALRRMYGR